MGPPAFLSYTAPATRTSLRDTGWLSSVPLSPRSAKQASCAVCQRRRLPRSRIGSEGFGEAHLRRPRSVPTDSKSRPSPPPDPHERAPDYWANVGTVIETLRHDYPAFSQQSPDYSIYADNIHFTDRRTFSLESLSQYRRFLWFLRLHLRVLFAKRNFKIQSLYHDTKNSIIYIRFRANFVPRFTFWLRDATGRNKVNWIWDAISVYKLNSDGWVREHVLENTVQSRMGLRPMFEEILSLGRVALPRGTPAGAGAGAGGLPQWWADAELWKEIGGIEKPYPKHVMELKPENVETGVDEDDECEREGLVAQTQLI